MQDKAPFRIDTARLTLAKPRPDDAMAIFERYASDPDVTRYLGWPRHRSLAETEAFLAFSDQEWGRWPAGPYLIWSHDDGRLLGGTGFGFQAATDAVITGYVLARDAWGNGYATEALSAVVRVGSDIGVRRLTALVHPDHVASVHVLEKCGFVRTSPQQTELPNLAPGVLQNVDRYERVLFGTGTHHG
jgi:ribosomal-protein-alanine N-acetyltransferase